MMASRFFLSLTLAATCSTLLAAQQPVAPAAAPAAAPGTQQAKQQTPDRYKVLADDYGQLARYAAANAALAPPAAGAEPRVIFYGDSITDAWHLDKYFPAHAYVNRGISGQTTPQMLVRFRQDVLNIHPAVVLLLAGTNDLAGNTGPETIDQIEGDYTTLAELSKANGIELVFASVTPVSNYVHPEMTTGRPPDQILALNQWLKQYCAAHNLVYLDYFAALVDPAGMLKKDTSQDGLHPNDAGYTIMAPLAQAAIDKALVHHATPGAGTTGTAATPAQ